MGLKAQDHLQRPSVVSNSREMTRTVMLRMLACCFMQYVRGSVEINDVVSLMEQEHNNDHLWGSQNPAYSHDKGGANTMEFAGFGIIQDSPRPSAKTTNTG